MSEHERLQRNTPTLRTSYQRDEFKRKRQFSESRLNKIRQNTESISRRIIENDRKLDQIKKNKLIINGAKNLLYEEVFDWIFAFGSNLSLLEMLFEEQIHLSRNQLSRFWWIFEPRPAIGWGEGVFWEGYCRWLWRGCPRGSTATWLTVSSLPGRQGQGSFI